MSDAVSSDNLAAVPSAIRWVGAAAMVVALSLFVILGNVLEVASDRDFYQREFEKYGVGRVTGLDRAQLVTVADTFIAYLADPAARLDVEVTVAGARRPLFNQREIAHMEDVQKLFALVRNGRLVAGAILLIVPPLGLGLTGSSFLPRLGTILTIGGVVTVALLGLAGLLSLIDFSEAFVRFHEMAFSNDLWILDPRTDYLIMLYPEGFWLDATLRIAMLSAIEAVVIGGVGLGIAYFGVRR
jgi:integral membrane protein (TIGR01906 family)